MVVVAVAEVAEQAQATGTAKLGRVQQLSFRIESQQLCHRRQSGTGRTNGRIGTTGRQGRRGSPLKQLQGVRKIRFGTKVG